MEKKSELMIIPRGLTWIGVSDIGGNLISVTFWFYLASLLNPASYGEIFYFLGIAGIAAYLSSIGTQNTIIVYVAKKIKLQTTFYFISLVLALISSIIASIIFSRIDIGFLIFGYVINTLVISELLGKKNFKKYSIHVLIQKGLTLGLGLGFHFVFGFENILYALSLSYIFLTIIILQEFKKQKIDFNLLKTKIGFVSNNYIMNITGSLNGQIDKLIIAPVLGFTILGNYSLALQITIILVLVPSMVYKFTLSHDATNEQNKKLKRFTLFLTVGLVVLTIGLSPVVIPIFFPEYEEVVLGVQIMSLEAIPGTLVYFQMSRLLGQEKSKLVIIAKSCGVIILSSGMIILGQSFGMIGLAVSLLISSTVQCIMLYLLKNRI